MIMTNHARTKKKVKKLKLKLFLKRRLLLGKQYIKRMAEYSKVKGTTIKLVSKVDKMANYAVRVPFSFEVTPKKYNQKKLRKLWRQCPHLRKAA